MRQKIKPKNQQIDQEETVLHCCLQAVQCSLPSYLGHCGWHDEAMAGWFRDCHHQFLNHHRDFLGSFPSWLLNSHDLFAENLQRKTRREARASEDIYLVRGPPPLPQSLKPILLPVIPLPPSDLRTPAYFPLLFSLQPALTAYFPVISLPNLVLRPATAHFDPPPANRDLQRMLVAVPVVPPDRLLSFQP